MCIGIYVHQKSGTSMFISTLFMTARYLKQLRQPSVEWINELSIFIKNIVIKINELLLCAMILMNGSHKYNAGQNVQTQKSICYKISFMGNANTGQESRQQPLLEGQWVLYMGEDPESLGKCWPCSSSHLDDSDYFLAEKCVISTFYFQYFLFQCLIIELEITILSCMSDKY